jgi:phosphoribosylamine--glycine ligase
MTQAMTILLIGSGGREHALAYKIAQSPLCGTLIMAPGNPGMAALGACVPVGVTDVDALVALAQDRAVDLVVVGPEAPLALGLADRLRAVGIATFGPDAAAAQLEASKGFTKDFCARWDIPTAGYVTCHDLASASAALDRFSAPYVLKADGLAAGKGVVIAESRAEAKEALSSMFGGAFGAAGASVVIEEFMAGEEASLFALVDGGQAILFGGAQDHKRVGAGDTGPNTGGMGTYAPAPVLSADMMQMAYDRIIAPTVRGMAAEGHPYQGVLFAGLMITADGPKLVEYNARFGDPETQVLMLQLISDIVPYLRAAATGGLVDLPAPQWRAGASICVVYAANGYPDAPATGTPIAGLDRATAAGAVVFHAGTKIVDGQLVAAGGRVLNVCASGATLKVAADTAYGALDAIDWAGGFCRRDIGWRALDMHQTQTEDVQ